MRFKLKFLLLLAAVVLATSCQNDNPVIVNPINPVQPDDPVKPDEPDEPEKPDVPTFSPLHVEGRWFVDENGFRHNLHGFAQTYSPWFNERGSKWSNYNVAACLKYNQGLIDKIIEKGWKMDFVRMHMDPYWSNKPNVQTKGENDISAFDFERFKKYLDEVFVPMAEYIISKQMYVVMRPPGVCPEQISIGGDYHNYLKKVWTCVANHPKLKNNGYVMFELANEPIQICDDNGKALDNWNGGTFNARGKQITKFMQEIVDEMRQYCNNILLIPGLHYQMLYKTFDKYPVKGDNIGYAVHCYPGWYNSGYDKEVDVVYNNFKSGWNNEIMPIGRKAPIVVTEMDWAPQKYDASWGKAITGVAGANGFGANFMKVCDESCNISWLLFTSPEWLAKYDDSAPDGNTFLTDPEACPRPVYRKYLEYATPEYSATINAEDYGK